jgi:plasmid maintenance system killer protein
MEVKFISVELWNYYTGNYSGKQKLPLDIIDRFKDKVDFIIVAGHINELSRMRSLNIEKIGDHWSARINKQYRIEFDFQKPNTILILKISKHYE